LPTIGRSRVSLLQNGIRLGEWLWQTAITSGRAL
jgi:hypothetical protein